MNVSRTYLALAFVAATVSPALTSAAVPDVDPVGKGALVRCGATNGVSIRATHADKIVFLLTGPLQAALPGDQQALDLVPRNTDLDIKVLDDPKMVADLKGKVLTFLGAANTSENRLQVRITQVLYAMVCPTTATP
jgi:hypothetical protein